MTGLLWFSMAPSTLLLGKLELPIKLFYTGTEFMRLAFPLGDLTALSCDSGRVAGLQLFIVPEAVECVVVVLQQS